MNDVYSTNNILLLLEKVHVSRCDRIKDSLDIQKGSCKVIIPMLRSREERPQCTDIDATLHGGIFSALTKILKASAKTLRIKKKACIS